MFAFGAPNSLRKAATDIFTCVLLWGQHFANAGPVPTAQSSNEDTFGDNSTCNVVVDRAVAAVEQVGAGRLGDVFGRVVTFTLGHCLLATHSAGIFGRGALRTFSEHFVHRFRCSQ